MHPQGNNRSHWQQPPQNEHALHPQQPPSYEHEPLTALVFEQVEQHWLHTNIVKVTKINLIQWKNVKLKDKWYSKVHAIQNFHTNWLKYFFKSQIVKHQKWLSQVVFFK